MELKIFKQNENAYRNMRDAALKNQPVASSDSADENIKGFLSKQ